jgi:hypothetical protein
MNATEAKRIARGEGRVSFDEKLEKLQLAQTRLKAVAAYITPGIAPQSAKKMRSALKSIQGAIRNVQAQAYRAARAERDKSFSKGGKQ